METRRLRRRRQIWIVKYNSCMIAENVRVIKIKIGFRNEEGESCQVAGYGIVLHANLPGEPSLIIADRGVFGSAERTMRKPRVEGVLWTI